MNDGLRITYRLAEEGDLDEICALVQAAVAEMERRGIFQWDEIYPDKQILAEDISKNQMYIGNMVQGVNRTINYKVHECRAVPKDEWIIVEDTHEPIIDRETFDKAQSLFKRNIHSRKSDRKADLFAGFLFCADCGKAMHKKVNKQNGKIYCYYKCSTKQKKSPDACTNHTIRIDRLEKAILAHIRTMINIALEYDEVIDRVKKQDNTQETDHIKRTLEARKKEREKSLKAAADLYPDWKNELITQEEYMRIRANLNEKIEKLDIVIANLQRTQAQLDYENLHKNGFVEHFMKYRDIDSLTRPMLVELIDKIIVHEGGKITIKVKHAAAFEAMLDSIEQQKESA